MTTSCKAETAASAHITCQVCVQPRWAHGLAAAPPLPGAGLCKLQCATGHLWAWDHRILRSPHDPRGLT